MTKSCILSLIAGLACTGAALAQDQEVITGVPFGGNVVVQPNQVIYANPPLRQGGFESRAVGRVYDNQTNHFGNGSVVTLGNCDQVLEDISFAGGPWGLPYANPRQISSITWGVLVANTPTDPAAEAMFLVFWNAADVNFQGFTGNLTNMINTSATPLQVITVNPGVNNPGFIYQFTLNALAIDIDPAANGVVLQAGWCSLATANNPATNWANLSGGLAEPCPNAGNRGLAFGSNTLAGVGGNPASVGSTTPDYGRDILSGTTCVAPTPSACTHAGIFQGQTGAPATGGCNEHRQIQVAVTGVARQMGYEVSLQGDIIAQAPTSTDLGVISDNQAPVNGTITTGAVRFYSFTLPGDATDSALQFLDIDTEGSAIDTAFAIYDNGGGLIASDEDSGSSTNAQLSFGVGRRASAGGDGLQYDGRTGELVAGTYYLAVAAGGSSFGSGYNATASTNPGGNFTLRLRTNVNGTPLAPSVPPIIVSANDYDGLFGPIDPNASNDEVREIPAHDTGLRGVQWSRFTLASDVNSSNFLDIEYCTLSTASADGVAYIFNDQGDIVAFSDDFGAASLLPAFTFGAAGPRDYGCGDLFNGGDSLPAGTYYVADALFPTDDLSFLPSGQRWHVRGTSGSNLTMTGVIHAGIAGGVTCDPDVNQDGVADQGDVDYLINVVAGGDNPTGINSDFNSDGVSDQGDVDALINTIASGQCP